MTLRIALLQRGDCAVHGALVRLRDTLPGAETMLDCDVAFTLFDSESEFVQALQTPCDKLPRLIVDFSPVSAALFARTHDELARAGVELVGVQSAAGGTLRLFGDTALQAKPEVLAVLRRAADEIYFTGACGTSKAMATVERLLLAVSCAASAEAIALATRSGLDARDTRDLLAKGSGANAVLATGAPCDSAAALQAIDRGQDLARPHGHALPLCASAKVFHQWQGACA